ncbi:permease prefix domain 1-containing protein [Kitasatospora sp. HPMI-4]|uniref:permease prefix domain 1-containing protein n=1 Tax=Kitasatospora sp. HPMI-4 TaxID=3448443 RepID=UPI003F1CB078
MTAALTDRYIAATVRRVPDKQRREIEQELRAAIADDVEARIRRGEAPADAEYAALCELGDPDRLAARYAHPAVALIGPDTYPEYLHALRGACKNVLPFVYIVLALIHRAHGENAWAALLRPIGSTMTVAVYLAVCVTVVFVIADRARGTRPEAGLATALRTPDWTPDRLPAAEQPRPATRNRLVTGILKAAALVAALFAQRVLSPVTTPAGVHVPLINPSLWGFWIPYLITVLTLTALLNAAGLRMRRSSPATAVAGAALTLAATAPLAWLFWQARVLNPALADSAGALARLTAPGNWIAWLAVLTLTLATAGALAEAWRTLHRDRVAV